MAERILAKAKAEQLWLEAIEKARKSDKTYELAVILQQRIGYGPRPIGTADNLTHTASCTKPSTKPARAPAWA
jgi:hypothetical protein